MRCVSYGRKTPRIGRLALRPEIRWQRFVSTLHAPLSSSFSSGQSDPSVARLDVRLHHGSVLTGRKSRMVDGCCGSKKLGLPRIEVVVDITPWPTSSSSDTETTTQTVLEQDGSRRSTWNCLPKRCLDRRALSGCGVMSECDHQTPHASMHPVSPASLRRRSAVGRLRCRSFRFCTIHGNVSVTLLKYRSWIRAWQLHHLYAVARDSGCQPTEGAPTIVYRLSHRTSCWLRIQPPATESAYGLISGPPQASVRTRSLAERAGVTRRRAISPG